MKARAPARERFLEDTPVEEMPGYERVVGVLALAVAGFTGYFKVWSPLRDAMRGALSIEYSVTLIVLSPALLVLGLIYTVFGSRASLVLGKPNQPTHWGYVFAGVLGLLGYGFFLLFEEAVRAFGYAI